MTLLQPWWLLIAVPALAVVVAVARAGRRTVPVRQNRVAVALRIIGVILLALALAQPMWVRPSGQKSVLFLLDRSSSIDAATRQAQEEFVAAALATVGPTDLAGVGVFGKDLRIDAALAAGRTPSPVRTTVDPTATDLAGALRGAAAVLPTEGSRRVVVLTDAVETEGDVRTAARELAEAGVAVDVIVLETGRSRDALITTVAAPVTARQGDTIPVEVRIEATAAGPAVLRVEAGGERIDVPVNLVAGTNVVEVEFPAEDSGVLRIAASIEAGFDQVAENDRGEVLVRVLGPARIAVVEGKPGEAEQLVDALEAGGMSPTLLAAVPATDVLLEYDAVVLVNVPAPGELTSADLAAYVEDLGRGLVVVGGDRAYGPGGYQGSALEALLPVRSDPEDLIRRQPVAELLVIDTSGSMADCHCGGGDDSHSSGVNKTDISRAGAGLAINALQETDRVGVLAFTSGTEWILPLGPIPSPTAAARALDTLTPVGDTEITQALEVALETLRDAPEQIKHIILFTDGWGDDAGALTVARDIADNGMTLSVLGTGEGSGDTLRRMAALGGGQFYAGQDLSAIPEIFVEETLRVSRPLISEGAFLPALGAASQVTAGLTATPPLRGYVLTREKATAQILLEIGPGDPLLAVWQRGLGRAAAWASDATSRWSADWIVWEGFADFWGEVVKDVLPAGLETPPEVRFEGGALVVRFTAEAPLDAVAVAQIRSATGEVATVPMQRTGSDSFEARLAVAEAGAYWVAVRVETANELIASGSNGVVAGYADEFAFRAPDPALATDVAAVTAGRVDPVAAAVFDPAPSRGDAATELWPWLAAAALALFLIDVALRRLVVARGDFEVWKEALTPSRKPPPAPIDTGRGPRDEEAAPPEREVHPEEESLAQLLRRKRR